MSKFTNGYNGISADMLSAVTQIARNSSKQHTEQAFAEKEKLANKFESFRPVAADKIERDARPIERLYAGMAPATRTEQKEETIAERVAAIKKPVTKHQPLSHDSYLLEPKITLEPKAKKTVEAEEVQLSDDDKAFLASLEVAEGTTPVKPEHKALAKLAEPKDKITHKDVLVGRGVFAKEEKEEGEAEEKKEKKANNPFDWRNYKSAIKKAPGEMTGHDSKKISTGMVYTKKAVKEDIEIVYEAGIEPTNAKSRTHVGNLSNPTVNTVVRSGKQIGLITKQSDGTHHAMHTAAKLAHAATGTFDTADKAHQFIRDAHAKAIKNNTLKPQFTEATEKMTAEELDTPGNSEHQCAIHVKHASLGEGKTLFSQHADPAEDGSIAWYDVMFAEGIQRVDTVDLEIVVSESHMNHKKKKK